MFNGFKFRTQVIQKERVYQLENIAFGGVVRPDLATFCRQHDCLEQRTEDGRGYSAPVETRTAHQRNPHLRIHLSKG